MKKNVAILINSLSPGGAERVVSILLKHLADDKSFTLSLILLEDEICFEVPKHVQIFTLSGYGSEKKALRKTLQIPFFAFKLMRLVKREKIGLVLSFLYRSDFVNVLASFISGHIPVVSQRVNTSSTYAAGGMAARLNRFLIARLYPRARLVINVSEGTKADLTECFGVDPHKQIVIYNPYDIAYIRQLAKEDVDWNWPREKTLIVVAWLRKIKNIALILDVFAQLESDLRLIVVGSGEEEERLYRQARQLGVARRIRFVGADTNPYKYMARAGIYISASSSEGFPNAMVEAMICGCCVVVSDCASGPREILSEDETATPLLRRGYEKTPNGILYTVGDRHALLEALQLVLENGKLRENMAQHGTKRAEMFSVENIVQEYRQTIVKLLGTV